MDCQSVILAFVLLLLMLQCIQLYVQWMPQQSSTAGSQDASDVAQIRCPRVGAFYLTQELNSASISVSNDIGIFCHQSGIFPISKLQSPPAPLNVSITIHAFIIIDLYNSHHGLHLKKKKHSG
jgi:hypothetical protein